MGERKKSILAGEKFGEEKLALIFLPDLILHLIFFPPILTFSSLPLSVPALVFKDGIRLCVAL